ncbi:MAG: ATP-binding domain-containing protein, partial [Anaerorhabdus sp.]
IMRQRDDKIFAEALNRMAVGMMNQNDIALFQSRVLALNNEDMAEVVSGRKAVSSPIANNNTNNNDRTIHLFFTNNDVQRFNNTILLSMDTEGAISNAYDTVQGSHLNQQKIDSLLAYFKNIDGITNKICLPRILLLKIEARYMVTTNVDTSDGLVNGITGVLKKIDYGAFTNNNNNNTDNNNNLSSAERKPLRVWLLFDDLNVGRMARRSQTNLRNNLTLNENWTMMEPRVVNINSHSYKSNLKLMRTQFPIFPAEALTVHKSQGSTFPRVTVYDVASRKLSRSLLYVACSRATTADGLTIVCKNNKFVPPVSLFQNDSSLRREIERQSTAKLELSFEHLLIRDTSRFTCQIISHNVQSLRAHINQIRKDNVYLSSNIIMLQETWTLDNNEDYTIDGFYMISRIDAPGSQPKPVGSCIYIRNEMLSQITCTGSKLFQQGSDSVSIAFIVFSNDLYCSLYATPNCSSELILESLEFMLEHCQYTNITITGDFNTNFKDET